MNKEKQQQQKKAQIDTISDFSMLSIIGRDM